MAWHQIFAVIAVGIAVISFFPYLRDILARKTTPHIYSWLIWAILQMTAAVAIFSENSFWSAAGTTAIGLVSVLVFLLSFKYGTKNITSFDTLCLVGALVAIGVWVFTQNIALSVILVTAIDFVGFLPTFRKAFEEPWSETVFLYACSGLSNFFSLFSITHYSIESTLYVASLVITNAAFVILVLLRRGKAANPKPSISSY
jgi:hypothetical protein